ncbi:hypothetical protein, partial [Xenorhabdus sp. TS4]|uniref:hypothetical protein n=1 Tax=Xenorhabdus sp. TS4 TaxID=1873483 RepID=UPI001CA39F65
MIFHFIWKLMGYMTLLYPLPSPMTSEFENARRKVARDCLKELTALPKYDDIAVTAILDKYT